MLPALTVERANQMVLRARSLLEKANTVQDVKRVSDIASAAKVYAQRAHASRDTVNQAAEIQLRAERKLGGFLSVMVKNKGGWSRRNHKSCPSQEEGQDPTLKELGISEKESFTAQNLSRIPEDRFEKALEFTKSTGNRLSRGGLLKANSEPQKRPAPRIHMELEGGEYVTDLNLLKGRHFGCIYADPPWSYSNQGTRGSANRHYSTLSVDDICALPIAELALPQSHLHLWTTNAFLFDAPKIFAVWGFEFKSSFVWVKSQMGIGNYWRNSHEIMLLAVKGGLVAQTKDLMSWAEFKRGKHSSKPEPIRGMVERLSPGPYLELFGRRPVSGWTVFGNEP